MCNVTVAEFRVPSTLRLPYALTITHVRQVLVKVTRRMELLHHHHTTIVYNILLISSPNLRSCFLLNFIYNMQINVVVDSIIDCTKHIGEALAFPTVSVIYA